MRWLLIALMAALAGCRGVQYVPVETVRTDSVYLSRVEHDSVLVRDSVFVREKGDTVTEYRYRYVYRHVTKTDTLVSERVDSVQVPYPVEARLTKWQQLKMDAGGYALVSVVVIIFITAGRTLCKLKKGGGS